MLQRRELMHTGEFMKDALNLDTKLGFEPMPQYVFLKKNVEMHVHRKLGFGVLLQIET